MTNLRDAISNPGRDRKSARTGDRARQEARQLPGRTQRWLLTFAAAATMMAGSGCDRAPSYSILGSFFPVWIFCFAAGLLLTGLVHLLLRRLKLDNQLTPAVLVYPSLTALFTMSLWLMFYS